MDRLRLEGPLPAWSDTALAGTLDDQKVMVFLGPDASSSHSSEADQDLSERWIQRTADHVVPLLDVVPQGMRSAWVHPRVEALGLVHLVDVLEGDRPPLRIAAELVAAVADVLVAVGPDGTAHPGPHPEDLAVDENGAIHMLGFVSPYPPSPTFRDPSNGTPSEQIVWRLGVLLAHLLSGRTPAVSDKSAHKSMIRRVLIRAMSREGPLFTERYRSWLVGMMSWEPTQRPALSAVGPGLRKVGKDLGGPELARWCAEQVPGRIRMARRAHGGHREPGEETESTFEPWNQGEDSEEFSIHPAELSGTRTLPGLPIRALPSDEVTAETTLRNVRMPGGGPRNEPGTMPVGIGPPAELMQKEPPKLPSGFLDDPQDDEPVSKRSTSPAVIAQFTLFGLLGLVIGAMLLLVVLVLMSSQ